MTTGHTHSASSSISALTDELADFAWSMARRMRQEGADHHGLSLTQVSILAYLRDHPGKSSAELARHEQITPQSMSTVVADMRNSGLIKAEPSFNDGRVRTLSLTEAGASALALAKDRRSRWLESRIQQQFDAATQRDLRAAIRTLSTLLDADGAPAQP